MDEVNMHEWSDTKNHEKTFINIKSMFPTHFVRRNGEKKCCFIFLVDNRERWMGKRPTSFNVYVHIAVFCFSLSGLPSARKERPEYFTH